MKKSVYLFVLLLLVCFFSEPLLGMEQARIIGKINSRSGNPLQNVRLILEGQENSLYRMTSSDESGSFCFLALPPGKYGLTCVGRDFQPLLGEKIELEPSQTQRMTITFSREDDPVPSAVDLFPLDYESILYQTSLNPELIHRTPTAHNAWSLVENLDLSATTNRIDVGGLWSAHPALFSSRGGSSWTQTEYYLNGMDVSDPYNRGRPLLFPDFYSLDYTQLTNAGHPVQSLGPGGVFNLITRRGGDELHGGASLFFLNSTLQSDNVSDALNEEGLFESHRFNNFLDGNIHLRGPVIAERLSYFASVTGFRINRDMAQFEEDDLSSALSGLFSLNGRLGSGELTFLWTGQQIRFDSYGAEREVPFSSTTERRETYHTVQTLYRSRISDRSSLLLGISLSQGRVNSDLQEGAESHGYELLTGVPAGLAAREGRDIRTTMSFLVSGESIILSGSISPSHILQYGMRLKYTSSRSESQIYQNHHRIFFDGLPIQVALFNQSPGHREAGLDIEGFFSDSLTLRNSISIYLGLHLAFSRGWAPDAGAEYQGIRWFNLSPRLGITFPLSRDKSSALRLHAARYFLSLPLSYLTFGHPDSPGALVYKWEDTNGDHLYEAAEQGALLRREGPFYGTIDPELKRPFVDELAVSFHKAFVPGWTLMVGLFTRETRNLIESVNTGIPFDSYDPVLISDIGDDRIFGSHDDLLFTVYNQQWETMGQDFYTLSNPIGEKRISKYYGADLTLLKRYGEKFTFFLSLTATQADGTTSPGNTEMENDHAVIGSLYNNPNSLIMPGAACGSTAPTPAGWDCFTKPPRASLLAVS